MDEPTEHDDGQARGANGKFIRTAETAERDAEACRLRSRGMSYRDIARELGYASMGGAYRAVQRALADIVREPAEEARQLELDRLDAALEAVMKVMATEHVVIQHGRVVELDGRPVPDDAPVLAAVDRIVKLSESRRKLLGLDAAQKLDVSGEVRYEIVGVDIDDLT